MSVSIGHSLSVQYYCTVCYVARVKLNVYVTSKNGSINCIKSYHGRSCKLGLPGDGSVSQNYCHLGKVKNNGLENEGVPKDEPVTERVVTEFGIGR